MPGELVDPRGPTVALEIRRAGDEPLAHRQQLARYPRSVGRRGPEAEGRVHLAGQRERRIVHAADPPGDLRIMLQRELEERSDELGGHPLRDGDHHLAVRLRARLAHRLGQGLDVVEQPARLLRQDGPCAGRDGADVVSLEQLHAHARLELVEAPPERGEREAQRLGRGREGAPVDDRHEHAQFIQVHRGCLSFRGAGAA
jgi:hypothetical protein